MRKHLAVAVAVAAAIVTCGLAAAGPASAKTVWLCKPGVHRNPCEPSLTTTRVSNTGKVLGVDRVKRAKRPKADCFYVYPTVSDDPGPQADLSIDPELRSIALYQAARYSRDCRVFAPVYRQLTLSAIANPDTITPELANTAYGDVRAAWIDYLKHYNKGRGVILIGHSQGTFMLRRLVANEIDPKASARKHLIAAYLLGGNVLVKKGSDSGGDFKKIRACRSDTQLRCVVAYSSFGSDVPADARFGTTTQPDREVLCNNPAALRGGSAPLDSIVPTTPFAPGTTMGGLTNQVGFIRLEISTPWLEARGAYRGRCVTRNGANVLQVTPQGSAPALNPALGASWGLHLADANLPLGNLADLARSQIAAYVRR